MIKNLCLRPSRLKGIAQLFQLLPHALRGQRLDHEPACPGFPCVEGVFRVGGQEHDIRVGIDLLQCAAQVKPAGRAQLNIQDRQGDPVRLRVINGLLRPDKARDRGVRHDLLQHGQTAGKGNLAVVHHDDIGRFIALRRKTEQRIDVHIETFCKAEHHRGVRQA